MKAQQIQGLGLRMTLQTVELVSIKGMCVV